LSTSIKAYPDAENLGWREACCFSCLAVKEWISPLKRQRQAQGLSVLQPLPARLLEGAEMMRYQLIQRYVSLITEGWVPWPRFRNSIHSTSRHGLGTRVRRFFGSLCDH
jgi:hypothetical protein